MEKKKKFWVIFRDTEPDLVYALDKKQARILAQAEKIRNGLPYEPIKLVEEL